MQSLCIVSLAPRWSLCFLLSFPLFRKIFYLVDVRKDIVALVHLDGEELAPYGQDAQQAFGFVDVEVVNIYDYNHNVVASL